MLTSLAKAAYCSHIAQLADLDSLHVISDHPPKLINCSLYHCRVENFIQICSYFLCWAMAGFPTEQSHGDPDQQQNFITCFFYHPRPLHGILLQSICNFLSNVANRQTDRQKIRPTNVAKEVEFTSKPIQVLIFNPWTAGVSGWISDSYCSIKPLCSGRGKKCRLVPRRPYFPHPLTLCCNYPFSKCPSASIVMTSTLRVKFKSVCHIFLFFINIIKNT